MPHSPEPASAVAERARISVLSATAFAGSGECGLAQLLGRYGEQATRRRPALGRSHPGDESIELLTQRLQVRLVPGQGGAHAVDRDEDGLRRVMLGDHDLWIEPPWSQD